MLALGSVSFSHLSSPSSALSPAINPTKSNSSIETTNKATDTLSLSASAALRQDVSKIDHLSANPPAQETEKVSVSSSIGRSRSSSGLSSEEALSLYRKVAQFL